jgi:mono/diheme cytochrome c family protein
MFTRNSWVVAAALVLVAPMGQGQESPGLGRPASHADVTAVDFTIMPDGEGLPDGSGNPSDGAELYTQYCLACHGEGGTGGVNDVLVGGHGSLVTDAPVKTIGSYWPYATTLFDYIRRAMPYQSPGILTDDQLYALTAYLLYLNDVIDEDTVLDAHSLPAVEMPNRDNFDWAYSPSN